MGSVHLSEIAIKICYLFLCKIRHLFITTFSYNTNLQMQKNFFKIKSINKIFQIISYHLFIFLYLYCRSWIPKPKYPKNQKLF